MSEEVPRPGDGDASGATGGAEAPLTRLLRVQAADTALDQLRHRRATAPERDRLVAAEQAVRALHARRGELVPRRDELAAAQVELERQIDAGRARRQQIDQRMRSGQVTAARDLTAMAEEMDHLAAHVSGLEDREIDIMEQLEPIDEELASIDADAVAQQAEAEAQRRAVADMEQSVDADIAKAERQRADEAASVTPGLLTQYERIRARAGGVGAARLVGTTCSGCHLEVPSMEVDRLRKAPPDAVMTCEQCGRILVP